MDEQTLVLFFKQHGMSDEDINKTLDNIRKQNSMTIQQAQPKYMIEGQRNAKVRISIDEKKKKDKFNEQKSQQADALTFGFTPTRNNAAQQVGAEDIATNVAGTLIGESTIQGLPRFAAMLFGRTNAGRALYLNRALNNAIDSTPLKFNLVESVNPIVRTRVGDVEIDNPNLYYRTSFNNSGLFNTYQPSVEHNGFIIPGKSAMQGQKNYSWWNKGKPYSQGNKGQHIDNLYTTIGDDSFLHVRSQKYPIGQWNGKQGFVLNSEYVTENPVNINNSKYVWDPEYGYRKVSNERQVNMDQMIYL